MAFSGGEIFLAFFLRLPLGFDDGEWTVRDPRRPGDQVSGHTQERPGSLQVITVPVTGNVENMIINIEGHASSVSTDTVRSQSSAHSAHSAQSQGLDKNNLAILS